MATSFIKLKLEGDEGIVKLKYNGESFDEILKVIPQKLKIGNEFDISYIDEEKEKVMLKDEDDWKIFLDISESINAAKTTGGPSNFTIFVKAKGERVLQESQVLSTHKPAPVDNQVNYPNDPKAMVHENYPVFDPSLSLQHSISVVSTAVAAFQQANTNAHPVFAAHNSALFAGSVPQEQEI